MTKPRNESLDAQRYSFLRLGGWEVLQDPKYWPEGRTFDEVVDAARVDCALTGIFTELTPPGAET